LCPDTPCPLLHKSFVLRITATIQGSSKQQQQGQGQRRLVTGGGAYKIDFAAANPSLYMPPTPYPQNVDKIWYRDEKIGNSANSRGNSATSIPNAMFNDGTQDVKVESLMPQDLYLGQIVPFEIQITVVGLESPEDGNMTFTAGWRTHTTMGGAFGYDYDIGVLAAFVDANDGAHRDPQKDAAVSGYRWSVVGEEIQGVFNVTGFDDGDVVVIEVWMVLQSIWPTEGATGNVQSRLIDASTLTTLDQINTGEQTIPLMVSKKEEDAFKVSSESRLGYDEWFESYDPTSEPRIGTSDVDGDNIVMFCG
jgi:hypothetical protein